MRSFNRAVVRRIGVLGHAARAVVFALLGVFVIRAAVEFDPNQAVGLDGALQRLAQQPAGPWLLALTALGSGLAGIAAANMRDPLRRGRALAAGLMAVFALSFVPTAVAGSVAVLAVALFVVGVPIAPLNALAGLAIQRIVAEPRQVATFELDRP